MKKRLSYLLQSLFVITLFLGYSVTVDAASYDYEYFTAQLYDNYGPTLSSVTTEITNNRYQGIIPSMTANTSGAAWGISSPITLLSNHTYAMTVTINGTFGGNIILSTYNRIGVGTSLSNAVTSYQNNSYVTENYSKVLNDGMTLQFAFTPTINGSYIVFPFATSSSGGPWTFYIESLVIDDLGSSGVTQDEINTSLTNQTNVLNSSIQNSTNTITGAITDTEENINSNIDDMEDAIIDSNKELEETVKDQFNSCNEKEISINFNNQYSFNTIGYIDTTNTIIENNQYRISDYIKLKPGSTFSINEVNYSANWNLCYYNDNKEIISCVSQTTKTYTFPSNATYLRFNSYVVGGKDTIFNGTVCSNKIDEQNETSKGIWETLKSIPSLILDGIKGLFVPSQEELQSLIDEFKETMETKLGAIYQVTDMLLDVFNFILSPGERNSCITFPEIKDPMFDKLLIEQTDYCFDTLRSDFSFLFTISDMIISLVCTLAFGNMLYKKFEGFIGGDTSDY